MPDVTAIKAAVDGYVGALAAGDVDAIAELFADDANAEDPVGSPVHVGREAIRGFFDGNPRPLSIELVNLRVAGNMAVFLLSAVIEVDGNKLIVEPIDVMTFDDNAKILTMRAVWGAENVRPA
ncbi:hypothetical protein ACG83_30585 [Frankia sp. R43]|uniref:nuclear transport factor 2 family protein n=1 Tax=Frankia sp. R43 TaxID=269536 RepID=UPI0006CA4E1E|nr:nuclear transport factor 2 family protein [Frankia sp. R43]KPM51933.1 hypothetical protein ACG83_30585 [Frankia sp. R43]